MNKGLTITILLQYSKEKKALHLANRPLLEFTIT